MNRGFRNCPLCRSPLPRLTPEEKAESRARYYRRCLCGATLVTIRNGRDWTTEI